MKTAIEAKDLDLALDSSTRVVEIRPEYVEGWNKRATVYFLKKDYESRSPTSRQALRARAAPFRRAVRPRHDHAGARRGQARDRSLSGARSPSTLTSSRVPDVVKALTEKVERPRNLSAASAASSRRTKAMRTMLVAPGRAERHAGDDDDALAGLGEAFAEGEPAGAVDHVVVVARHPRATTQCTPQTSAACAPVATFGEIATIGGLRPLARDAQRGRARGGPAARSPTRSSVSAIWRAAAAMASAPVASGSVRCAWMMRAVVRVALHLLGDAVHGRDRLDRILRRRPIRPTASRRRRPRRSAVATSDTSARVGTGLEIIDSSIWVATTTGLPARRAARVICFWMPGHLLERHLDAEIAARHHQRVGELDDLGEPLTACGFSILAITPARPRAIFLASAMSSGRWTKESAIQSTPASSAASRSERSLAVRRRERDRRVGKADALAVGELAADLDAGHGAPRGDALDAGRRILPSSSSSAMAGLERREDFGMRQVHAIARRRARDRRRARRSRPASSIDGVAPRRCRRGASAPAGRPGCRSAGRTPSRPRGSSRRARACASCVGVAHIDAEDVGAGLEQAARSSP